jgi:hypothetical protein
MPLDGVHQLFAADYFNNSAIDFEFKRFVALVVNACFSHGHLKRKGGFSNGIANSIIGLLVR